MSQHPPYRCGAWCCHDEEIKAAKALEARAITARSSMALPKQTAQDRAMFYAERAKHMLNPEQTPEQIATEEAARAFPEADHRAARCEQAILAALRRQSQEAARLRDVWREKAKRIGSRPPSHDDYYDGQRSGQQAELELCASELEALLPAAPGSTPTQETE